MKSLGRIMVFVLLGASAALGQAASNVGGESKIIALERLIKLQAYSSKDLKTLDALLDERFIDIEEDGTLRNRAEFLTHIQMQSAPHYAMQDLMVRLHGDTAIATGIYQVSGNLHGKEFVRRGRFVDSWLIRNGEWVEIASLSTPVE